MKTEKQSIRKLRALQSTVNYSIGKLDMRGTDKQITKAIRIIDAVMDAAIFGGQISADQAFKRGVELARCPR
jgi:hypothetical protein